MRRLSLKATGTAADGYDRLAGSALLHGEVLRPYRHVQIDHDASTDSQQSATIRAARCDREMRCALAAVEIDGNMVITRTPDPRHDDRLRVSGKGGRTSGGATGSRLPFAEVDHDARVIDQFHG